MSTLITFDTRRRSLVRAAQQRPTLSTAVDRAMVRRVIDDLQTILLTDPTFVYAVAVVTREVLLSAQRQKGGV